MTTAKLVNRIIAKLHPQSEVVFVRLDESYVVFDFGHHRYIADVPSVDGVIVREVFHNSELFQIANAHSKWIEGVLNGKTRDDAGVLA